MAAGASASNFDGYLDIYLIFIDEAFCLEPREKRNFKLERDSIILYKCNIRR